ncbi:TPA: transposase domain-containing protein [Klebsiella pneumoniae]|uniref:transposase domain-containing protein n=1 Tax=Klebsiella pneumoniae TaxID=573 RepID=UPI001C81E74E|nr:transposase domain-containing protein [Klebsiella pneumoniae]EKW2891919.1 Mu transposase C-terminal domain-containing protein [Klebsiella pneumoniae]ELA0627874.1 Mu transposase C-terminal domain-containing protein [Klebsiella pneumoniae]MBX4703644.1 transposase [Klebsiella pneumoniae]MCD9741427.1 Mu transposase C-terminal domain-containing protein [Klebsiella pneumoniae]MCW9241181.1 Mu transposase C-terminal domain-containing protein [Klebsiella pneumoniae]
MDLWLTVKECSGLPGMPKAEQHIRKHLQSFVAGRDDMARKRPGSKAVEYCAAAFPVELRAAILKQRSQAETSRGVVDVVRCQTADPARARLWRLWESASDKQRDAAKSRVEAVIVMAELIASGVGVYDAAASAGRSLNISKNTLRSWYTRTQRYARSDWAPVLLDSRVINGTGGAPKTSFDELAWEFVKTDYLRQEQPNLSVCYERLKAAAQANGWTIPSVDTVRRRIEAIPAEIRILKRQGEHALSQLYPAQRRTIANLSAGEWINGDGYKHNVWVIWHNGEEVRPKVWYWQDVYSRKILGYYADISENTDSIRYSLLDVISKYGKPQQLTLDNTRAAANKTVTGGVPNRYRFKVREDDPIGIIPLLGINLHWTTVEYGYGNGRAKPVERTFGVGGVGEYVDKHPLCAGAWTGPDAMHKPDYQHSKNERGNKTRPISVDVFMQALAEGVAMFNAKIGRNTEACAGKHSFDQAFAESYSQRIHEFLPEEQLRMLMLCSEATTVRFDGRFTLKSGGQIQRRENVYKAPELLGARVKKVVVRFDPRNLHGDVYCYDLDGNFICTAVCDQAVAFGDTQAAREHKRLRTQKMRAVKKAAAAGEQISILELAEFMAKPDAPEPPRRAVVALPVAGNTARIPAPVESEPEDNSDFNSYMNAIYEQEMG